MTFETIRTRIEELSGELSQWRRDFHRHPELAFQETRTSAVIRRMLEEWGIEVRACGGTGLRAVLTGGRPGRTVALRADMDALPVTEENTHDFRSENVGTMHACGHDGHMAILLGVAKVLSERRGELAGRFVFLFQPSEENPPGGAPGMIAEGALDDVDSIYGLHLWQPLPTGVVGLRAGASMAQADEIRLVVHGKGGHASQPQATVDPVLTASHCVVAAQAVASRFTDPVEAVVVSFTTFHGGRIHNIIPDSVELTGTVRTLNPDVQRAVKQQLREVCESVCRAFGARAEFVYEDGYPPVINDAASVAFARQVAESEFGAARVVTIPPVMGGEDFAYYLQKVPGAFLMLGMGDGCPYPHHNARFDLDERSLAVGVRLLARVALESAA